MMAGKVCNPGLFYLWNRSSAKCGHFSLGQSQFLTSPMLAKPLQFNNLSLDDPNYDEELTKGAPDSDTRLMQMLAAQAQHLGGEAFGDVDAIAADEKLSDEEKKTMLQKALVMSASNGDLENVKKILGGKARSFVDINAPDEDGTPALVYASCFVSLASRNTNLYRCR